MEYHQMSGFMLICMTLIGNVAPTQVFTAHVCTYYWDRKWTCNENDVQCSEGHVINIETLFTGFAHPCACCSSVASCSNCCGDTPTRNTGNLVTQLKSHCNNKQYCRIILNRYSDQWRQGNVKVSYTCIPHTTAIGETTIVATISNDPTDSGETTSTTKVSVDTTTATTTNSGDTTSTTTVNITTHVVDTLNANDSESDDLDGLSTVIAVAIPMAIIALILGAVTVCYVIRKRRRDAENLKDVDSDVSNTNNHNLNAITNQAYTNGYPDDDVRYANILKEHNLSASQDSGCVGIPANKEDNLETDEYNTIDFNRNNFAIDAGYGHLPKQEHTTDNIYSHISGNHSAVANDTTYSHIVSNTGLKRKSDITNEENDQTYNKLQTAGKRVLSPRAVFASEEDEYSHANFARSATRQGNPEEYSRLGTKAETTYRKQAHVQVNSNDKSSNKDMNDCKPEDEYANVSTVKNKWNK